ncbi:MAG: TolC family outer membrane protein [Gammaproteobacteria bacterium]|nr:TolC family outer membrane protein [Gammaproteobacteria bacterium]
MKRVAVLVGALLAGSNLAAGKDLAGVFDDAVKNDPVIRQANANRLAAREARPQAWSAVLPQINGTASVIRDHSAGSQDQVTEIANPANPTGPPLPVVVPLGLVTDTTTKTWALNLRSNLFSWTNWMNIKAASAEVAQAEANYQSAEQQLILRVAQAYFNVLAADASLQANQSALEAIARQLDQANKRFDVGLIAITDVQEAKAARDTAAAAVIAAKRTLATNEDQLQEITGQKYDTLARPGDDMPLRGPEPKEESRWVGISLEQNLALISSRLAAEIARDNVRAAIGGHLPSLDLVAGRSYTHGLADETVGGLPFSGVADKFNDRQIGLQLTLPIFSGGFTQSRVRESEYRWIAAKEAVVQTSRATERQARDAYLGVISGIARVQALRQAVESSQTALRATEAGYEVGTRTAVDVLNSRRTLVQSQTDYANARYDYIVNVLQLRLAAGNLDRAQLNEINTWLTVSGPTSPPEATPENVLPFLPAPTQPATPPPQTPPPG